MFFFAKPTLTTPGGPKSDRELGLAGGRGGRAGENPIFAKLLKKNTYIHTHIIK